MFRVFLPFATVKRGDIGPSALSLAIIVCSLQFFFIAKKALVKNDSFLINWSISQWLFEIIENLHP